MGKTYVVADIHGNIKALGKMLKQIDLSNKDNKLILLGDYIDRGFNSYHVVKCIQSLQRKYGSDRVIALMGNHELLLVDYLKSIKNYGYASRYETMLYFQNGGEITLESYERENKAIMADYHWFNELPLYYEGKTFIAVHAGLKAGVELSKQTKHDLLWIREEFYNMPEGTFEKTIIFGHTATQFIEEFNYATPVIINGNIAIDTYAVGTGVLTAVVIDENDEIIDFMQTR